MPGMLRDAKGWPISAIHDPYPAIFFEPKRVYRSFKEEVPEENSTDSDRQSEDRQRRHGCDRDHLGRMDFFQCPEALDQAPERVSVELIDLRTIYPIDIDTIAEEAFARPAVSHLRCTKRRRPPAWARKPRR